MNIQTLSVVVPNKVCINHCESCPSRMHDNNYPILIDDSLPDFDLYLKDYLKRLEFARKNNCNTLMLTGTSEPQQNKRFLLFFGMMMQLMKDPFQCIEMQTTGVTIDWDYLMFMRRHVELSLLALSVFSLNDEENMAIIHPPAGLTINTQNLAQMVKEQGISLRMCLNLTKHFDRYRYQPDILFNHLRLAYNADQVTLRVLYADPKDSSKEAKWVRENSASKETVDALTQYVKLSGNFLGVLPYGAEKYGVMGMSVVVDSDSMGKDSKDYDSYKYLILRPNCKLYSSWDDPASLVF